LFIEPLLIKKNRLHLQAGLDRRWTCKLQLAICNLLILYRMNEVTRVLCAIERGDPNAAGELLPLVYDELRRLAAQKMAQEAPGQTLQSTALVHEAYLRLVASGNSPEPHDQQWNSRGHFFAAAAEAMRRILVENARRKKCLKHGGDRSRLDLDAEEPAVPEPREDLLALDDALNKLAEVNRGAADLVQLRYFAGLALPDAARILAISPRTAGRLWTYARAWLRREIEVAGKSTEDS
jgi:RNA polymerase sigma factor (TIGR02999 family)